MVRTLYWSVRTELEREMRKMGLLKYTPVPTERRLKLYIGMTRGMIGANLTHFAVNFDSLYLDNQGLVIRTFNRDY